MEQLSAAIWGLVMAVSILATLGAAAMAFGADSRSCVGDSHTGPQRGDWF